MKNIILFGASGFVGEALLSTLLCEYKVFCFGREEINLRNENFQFIKISKDLHLDLQKISKENSIEAVIYAIGIIKGKKEDFWELHYNFPKKIYESVNCKKFVYISAIDSERKLTEYQKSKFSFEEFLVSKKKEYLILKPSVVTGFSYKYNFVNVCINTLGKFFIVPLINSGKNIIYPIERFKLAKLVLENIENNSSVIWELKDNPVSLKEFLEKTYGLFGKKYYFVSIPGSLLYFLVSLFSWTKVLPVTKDQLIMLINKDQ